MARSIASIQTYLTDALVSNASAVGWTVTPDQWSVYDYKRLMIYIIAVAMATLEQLWDAFKVVIEAIVETLPPQTAPWWKAQMLKFQYSSTDPQEIQLNTTTLAPYYPTVNTTLQIIKYCSVTAGGLGVVNIKCASQSSGLPLVLDSLQLASAQSYVNTIGITGIYYNVQSSPSDKLWLKATIYYRGIYSAVISANVISAITTYLANIPFDGVVQLDDLLTAIRNVQGVNRIIFNDVKIRPDGTAFGGGTGMVASNMWINDSVSSRAGYVEGEDTSGQTFADTLTFIAE
jgi:hypothetical protein